MGRLGAFFEHVLIDLVVIALIVVAIRFGAPALWSGIQAGEQAKVTAHAEASALNADTTAASRAQKSCASEIEASGRSAAALAKSVQPQPVAQGQPRRMILGPEINGWIQ